MTVSSTTNTASYVGNGSQTTFAYTFRIFEDGDLVVLLRNIATGVETVQTLTTDYTVTGAGNENGGNVVFGTAPPAATTVFIRRVVDAIQETDYVENDPFPAESHEDALDRITMVAQQNENAILRSLKFPQSEVVDAVIPNSVERAGKYLAFNQSTGVPEAGPSVSDVQTVSAASQDIATLADIEDGTTATDAISDTAAIASDVTAVANIASNVTTVANDSTDIGTVATDLTGSDTIGTVAANISDVSAVAAIDSDVTAVAAIDSDVTAVAADATDIGTVATDLAGSDTIGTVAGIAADVSAVAAIDSDVSAVAADATDIGTVSSNIANVNTVAGISANVTTVAGISSDVTTVAGDSADIQAVAADATDIGTVASSIADVNSVAGAISDVSTVASNLTDVQSFANTYRIGSSDPVSSLDEGDLFFNTTDNALKYYDGASWASITAGLTDIVGDTTPQLGGDLDLNSNDITGTGDIDNTGTITTDGLTVAGNVSVDGGTIKLDGNYPVGTNNVALGDGALDDGSLTGGNNTAVGTEALTDNTSGAENVAVGHKALFDNTTGSNNTAVGRNALRLNSTASNNTAVGYAALDANTTGIQNVAIGTQALDANTTASNNTAVGYQAGYSGTTGDKNTFLGHTTGYNVTTGTFNTFLGYNSGADITTGSKNTIIGRYNGNQGGLDIRTSSNNIVLSDGDGDPRLHIDDRGLAKFTANVGNGNNYGLQIYNERTGTYGDANNLRSQFNGTPDNNISSFFKCGDTSVIRLVVWSDGDVDNHDNSYGGTSDERLKEQIIDASSQWDDIKSLNVRKFKFKSDVAEKGDSDEHWRLGVIAQEVEAAGMNGLVKNNPVYEDGVDTGEVEKSVKYSILYMKAVKALQEAMDRIETLEAKVATLESN